MGTVREPDIGECVKSTGAVIPHIMRSAYIGKKVLYNISTQSMRCYRCGVLEEYIPYEGKMRSVIFYGKKQRALVTHYAGVNIYECLPWDAYPERAKAWKQAEITPVQLSLF